MDGMESTTYQTTKVEDDTGAIITRHTEITRYICDECGHPDIFPTATMPAEDSNPGYDQHICIECHGE